MKEQAGKMNIFVSRSTPISWRKKPNPNPEEQVQILKIQSNPNPNVQIHILKDRKSPSPEIQIHIPEKNQRPISREPIIQILKIQ